MSSDRYQLSVNGQHFEVQTRELVGLQIRALAAIDPAYDLVLEGEGSDPDRILGDGDTVALTGSPKRIFTRPPTAFG
ncbi:multiubiquitin domain-containing protein [Bradyrhizobium sp. BR 1432]|uniref:multiubiquitin domain-containing protein n=1 Tax=Bradyrhizobium sp. BR 1432 TaxID=3447966 RepID=UPI003EE66D79